MWTLGWWGIYLELRFKKKKQQHCEEITLDTNSYSRLFYAKSSYSHCLFLELDPPRTCDTPWRLNVWICTISRKKKKIGRMLTLLLLLLLIHFDPAKPERRLTLSSPDVPYDRLCKKKWNKMLKKKEERSFCSSRHKRRCSKLWLGRFSLTISFCGFRERRRIICCIKSRWSSCKMSPSLFLFV